MPELNSRCHEYITLLPVVNELVVLVLSVDYQKLKWSLIMSSAITYILLKVFSVKCKRII